MPCASPGGTRVRAYGDGGLMSGSETRILSEFIVRMKRPGTLDPTKTITHRVIRCPVCGHLQARPKDGDRKRCEAQCGASWTRKGAAIHVEYEGNYPLLNFP